ncbi:uncharacterized protein LOC129742540 [Uranotaenia lowii]|uniref:uncharacterized protein LOC129742540 n=1 Tax=Uranotaenia lowii TaxID=190385 RepID=UPI002478530C|nr:uncharacterized protein LOC129742540 [Uranotaenia lowii]
MGKLIPADVENEYKKFPELKREDVQKLREWMVKQPHLPKITELELILFLHSNYHRMEATKNTLDANYTCRTHVPELFANWDIIGTELKNTMDLVTIMPLPKPTNDGYTVVLGKLIDSDTSQYTFESCLKFLLMIADVVQRESGAVPGYVFVLDMRGVTLGHVAKLSIGTVKKFMHYLQEGMPIRLKGIHLTHVVPFIDKILMIIKPFMHKDLLDLLHLHTSLDTLDPFVPRECLTEELGGKAGAMMDLRDNFNLHMIACRDFLLQEEKKKAVEDRRPGKPKDSGAVFGMEGNFKKLDKLELSRFLHSNYFKMEATKQTIDNYYTYRTHIPMFFANRDILNEGTRTVMDILYGMSFPKQTHEGYEVFYGCLKVPDTSRFDIGEIFKMMIALIEVHFLEKGSADGYRIIIDMQNVTFGHVARLGVMPLKNFLTYLQEAMPIRLKGLHFANVVPFMDAILALIKPFMKKELMEVLYLHQTNEQMHQYIGKECLPEDCGGECESREVLSRRWYDRLIELREFFLEEERTQRVDESKRPGKSNAAGRAFGIEGNFRKLDID